MYETIRAPNHLQNDEYQAEPIESLKKKALHIFLKLFMFTILFGTANKRVYYTIKCVFNHTHINITCHAMPFVYRKNKITITLGTISFTSQMVAIRIYVNCNMIEMQSIFYQLSIKIRRYRSIDRSECC